MNHDLKHLAEEREKPGESLMTEFLVLPDGKVLVQNLTPAMASILIQLNPNDAAILSRVPPGLTHHASRITHHV